MKEILQNRTKQFALDILDLSEHLPEERAAVLIAHQLTKSATSVGANYRAACRAADDKEFIYKMNKVLEEADESCYWLEIIDEKGWVPLETLAPIMVEADELTAIFVQSLKTINRRIQMNARF